MKQEVIDWLDRATPIHLSALFTTDALRRESRFDLAAIAGLLVLEPQLGTISTVWEHHSLRSIITRLVQKHDLIVGEELQIVLDLGLYSATLNVLFADLWDARFDYCETSDATWAIEALVQTSFPKTGPATRESLPLSWVEHDIALFWLTLARQNDILDRVVVWLPLDATADTYSLHHLHQFILSAERWTALGAPLRFLIGLVEGSGVMERVDEHPLSKKLRESVVYAYDGT